MENVEFATLKWIWWSNHHRLLEPHEAVDMLAWDHGGGGFSPDGSVHIEATDRTGLEREDRKKKHPTNY